jgi:hypothetical protein
MKRIFSFTLLGLMIAAIGVFALNWQEMFASKQIEKQNDYWFVLHRQSQTEELLRGVPGDREQSEIIKTFKVKTGRPGERPTPLPQLVGREYWIITKKQPEPDNPETAPYFITLDVPAPSVPPYGPEPYLECNGQCDWVRPGDFGLHGIAGVPERLTEADPGSSGCIRHTDEDITYLYNLLEPEKHEIRYYVQDN